MTIKLRYKEPSGEVSKLITHPVIDGRTALSLTSDNFRFSAAVAEFGLLLRDSEYKQNAGYKQVTELANTAKGTDNNGYRSEFIQLVNTASSLDTKKEVSKK